jgi:hypothetical protein
MPSPAKTLDVIITSMEGNAVFTILGPDDNRFPGTEEGKDINIWTVPIIVEGIYTIVVVPPAATPRIHSK